MGLLTMFAPAPPAPPEAPAAVVLSEQPVAEPGDTETTILQRATAVERLALRLARSIPAVRKAEFVIAGTLSTWPIVAYRGDQELPPDDPNVAWLSQPDPRRTRQWILTKTFLDLIWQDHGCLWKVTDRALYGATRAVERIHPDRISTVPGAFDADTVDTWIIDGKEVTDLASAGYVHFDHAGLGGLRTYGFELLTLYGQLQTAAGRYAKVPHPYAILENEGEDLEADEITTMLDAWQAAREVRGVGYTNRYIKYRPQQGWSAKELQLTEAREYSALEVARLFGLPAFSLDASTGDPMTYANTVDRRKDEIRALRPWRTIFEQTLSMDDRRGRPRGLLLPHGTTARLDPTEYLREVATDAPAPPPPGAPE